MKLQIQVNDKVKISRLNHPALPLTRYIGHHLGRQVQDFWLRFRYRFLILHDGARQRPQSGRSRPHQKYRNRKGTRPAARQTSLLKYVLNSAALDNADVRFKVLAEDAIQSAIRDYNSKRKAGHKASGSIDVSQSVATGRTETQINLP
jgi:hypothetical protein